MKKIYYYSVMAMTLSLAAWTFSSCSDDEDATPSHADVNKFVPADTDQSVEAGIRRNFKEQTNSYLLFNDTLSKEREGEDMYGNPVYKVETLDINYELVGSGNSYIYLYDYIKDDAEKQKAADFVASKLAKKLGQMSPYSYILVNGIQQCVRNSDGVVRPVTDGDGNPKPSPIYVLGSRCLAISVEKGAAYDEPDFFASMLEDIVYKKISSDNALLKDFYAAVENYNRIVTSYKDDLGYDLGFNNDLARSLGLVRDYNYYFFARGQEWETRQYLKEILSKTEDEIETEYASYPICLKRFAILRSVMERLGFNFDM